MAMSAAERQQLLNEGYSEEDINQMEAEDYDPTAKPGKGAPQASQSNLPADQSDPFAPDPGVLPGTGANSPSPNVPYQSTEDPNRMVVNNRDTAQAAGDEQGTDIEGWRDTNITKNAGYTQAGDMLANDLITNPGYNTGEQAAITDQPGVDNLTMTDAERSLQHLSPAERAAMGGDPDRASQFLRPAHETNLQERGTAQVRQAGDRQRAGFNQAIQQGEGGYDEAIDPERLRMDPAYAAAVEEAGGAGVSATNEAVNDPSLDVSPEYLRDRGWSDADIAKFKGVAAQRGMANYRSAESDMVRNAAMQGNVSPLAVAQVRRRFEKEGAVQSADAAAYAEMLGENAQRDAVQSIEDTRLGAADTRTGYKVRGAQQAYDIGSGSAQDVESTRLGSEQFLTEAEMAANEDILNSRMESATTTGNNQIGIETSARDTDVALAQDQEQQNIDVFGDAEATRTLRATDIAKNRQNTDQSIAETDLNTEVYQHGETTGAAQLIADAEDADLTEGLTYVTDQGNVAGTNVNVANQQQNTNLANTNTATANAANTGMQGHINDNDTSFGTQVKRGVGTWLGNLGQPKIPGINAEGGLITKPTLAIIGESGPERITPVSGPGYNPNKSPNLTPDATTAAANFDQPTSARPPVTVPASTTQPTPSDNPNLPIRSVLEQATRQGPLRRKRKPSSLPFPMRPDMNRDDLGGDGRQVSAGPLY